MRTAMSKRIELVAVGVMMALATFIVSRLEPLQAAPAPLSPDPVIKHGLEVRVRDAAEAEYSDKTKKIGVEFYLDGDGGNGVYIDEVGDLATIAAKLVAPEDAQVKAFEWSHGLVMKARKAGEKDFGKETHRYGVEVCVDENNGNYLYVCETGTLAAVAGKVGVAKAGKDVKPPDWKNAMELRVRKAGEPDFNDKTKKIGVEVLIDANNGNVVYLSETGSIAVLPSKWATMNEAKKAPDWMYGLEVNARKAGEKEFSKDTKRYGVEVYHDGFAGAVLYIGETGAIACAPAILSAQTETGAKTKGPEWKRAMELDCRKAGEAAVSKDTKRFGVEVYFDPNTGNTVYISETGAMSVVPAKDAG
jgi:hypothetical protein